MIGSGWWEFEGEEKKLPEGLVYRKRGGFDMRYKINREFNADERWVYRNPVLESVQRLLEKHIQASIPLFLEGTKLKKNKPIKFKRIAGWEE